MGSITSWIRLEPRRRDDMSEAVHARVYDPLWMLARQWQTGEFQGEDTGTPVPSTPGGGGHGGRRAGQRSHENRLSR